MSLKSKISPSLLIIILYMVVIPPTNFNHHRYLHNEGVIVWDVKSYYAYLPAAFIHKDLTLSYMDEDMAKHKKWVWPITTPTGNKAILTTMGISIMYSPFFFIAHLGAKISDQYEADGYSVPYHIALTFSALFYLLLALYYLRKLLLKYFSEFATALTLFVVGFGTNLFYYSTYEAPMSHVYSFTLIVIFMYYVDLWWKTDNKLSYTILLGLLSGLITLIRPTNITVLLLIPLFGLSEIRLLGKRIVDLLLLWKKILLMALCFFLIWTPQFLYWYKVSGQFLYFSYGEVESAFFFTKPQLLNVLFSWKKGLFIYTPIMFVATVGIFYLFKQKRTFSLLVLCYFLINLYILSCWWSWWFGGGYSIRAYIDSYGIMALPLAALIDEFHNRKKIRAVITSLLILLTCHNLFQTRQYNNVAIHYFWMNKEAYFENFLKFRPTCKYWHIVNQPNVPLARKGVYETMPFYDSKISREDLFNAANLKLDKNAHVLDSLLSATQNDTIAFIVAKESYINHLIDNRKCTLEYKELRIQFLKDQINNCESWRNQVERMARKKDVEFDEMADIEAKRIFETYSQKYILQ